MKKSKLFKTISFSSLALLMGIAGTMAFAPLGAGNGNVAGASEVNTSYETEQGLITPKADDPVIYTTESGLEIKWGNYAHDSIGGNEVGGVGNVGNSLSSGYLSGFPYFTTNDGTTDYTWVIIGKASDVGTSIGNVTLVTNTAIDYKTLTEWKTLAKNSYCYQYYNFFNYTYEETSPAGSALKSNNILNNTTAWWQKYIYLPSIALNSSVKTDTKGEIPSGCVLVLANQNTGTGVYNTGTGGKYSGSYIYINCHTTYVGNIKSVMDNYYANGTLGLAALKSKIVPVTLQTYGRFGNDAYESFTFQTQVVENCYVFPLAGGTSDTFYALNYLTAAQASLSVQCWLRGGNYSGSTYTTSGSYRYYYSYAHTMTTAGGITKAYGNASLGYRPAFCLKVV